MQSDAELPVHTLKVDGGASANNLLMQFQADVLGCEIVRPALVETTALGAALLAGITAGVWKDTSDAARAWKEERRFKPQMSTADVDAHKTRWRSAVDRA
jgi:glycerol kinase